MENRELLCIKLSASVSSGAPNAFAAQFNLWPRWEGLQGFIPKSIPPSYCQHWHQLESPRRFPFNIAGNCQHLLSVPLFLSRSLKQRESFIVSFKVIKCCFCSARCLEQFTCHENGSSQSSFSFRFPPPHIMPKVPSPLHKPLYVLGTLLAFSQVKLALNQIEFGPKLRLKKENLRIISMRKRVERPSSSLLRLLCPQQKSKQTLGCLMKNCSTRWM